ncbi:MAG TPA: NADPH:quinone reductase [Gammaproteobacteria bacterium]|nr:NADPH:quinone reductase [Gammaproteobacteria bacterium]
MAERLMQAIRVRRFGGPEVLCCEDVPIPSPEPRQVLVQVHAAGVNPVDTYIRTGTYARKPDLPYTPGSDAAGIVAALGRDVEGLAVGDRVYTSGTVSGSYADYAICNDRQVFRLPVHTEFTQGAALGTPYATAWRALFQRGRAVAGETVLVHGATGGVGLAAVQLAAAAGLRIFATGGSDEGRELVLKQGAHEVFDHHADDYLERIQAHSGGIDLVLEMLANVNLDHDLEVLAPGGRVVVIGSRGRIEIDPRRTMQKETAIFGMTLFNASEKETRSIHAGLGAGLANGSLSPVIGRRFVLADAAEAHRAVMESNSHGKIVLLTSEGEKDGG